MEPFDIVILGGGMAGLSAALYGGWLGRRVFLAEKQMFGGQIVNADQIENYPGFPDAVSGADLVANVRMQAMKFGARMRYLEVTALARQGDGFLLQTTEDPVQARAVIVATGGRHRRLGIPNETELEGRGVSRCATCDGTFFQEKPVAVIGGGDTAFDEALYLANICQKVTIVHRHSAPSASATLIQRARESGKINLIANACAEAFIGSDSLQGVRLTNGSTVEAAGVFIAIGFEPDTALLKNLVALDPMGHARVDIQMQTSVPGLFAVGAARQGNAGQLVTAAGDGVTAVTAASRLCWGTSETD
jgi:thioredoxin reductase (NADPH)